MMAARALTWATVLAALWGGIAAAQSVTTPPSDWSQSGALMVTPNLGQHARESRSGGLDTLLPKPKAAVPDDSSQADLDVVVRRQSLPGADSNFGVENRAQSEFGVGSQASADRLDSSRSSSISGCHAGSLCSATGAGQEPGLISRLFGN